MVLSILLKLPFILMTFFNFYFFNLDEYNCVSSTFICKCKQKLKISYSFIYSLNEINLYINPISEHEHGNLQLYLEDRVKSVYIINDNESGINDLHLIKNIKVKKFLFMLPNVIKNIYIY